MSKEIILNKGYACIVDDEDHRRLSRYRWKVDLRQTGHAYAVRNVRVKGRMYRTIRMHRDIIGAPDKMQVDHINGNGLDNRRANIRVCTPSQNQWNSMVVTQNRSRKGVYFHPNGKWVARIQVNKRRIHLGCFSYERDALVAYDRAAKEYFGEFARLNFPDSARDGRVNAGL